MLAVGFRQAGVLVNIATGRKQPAVAAEIFRNISAELKAVHDVGESGRVRKAEGVTGFVEAGEIDDGVAEQGIAIGAGGGQDIDFGAADAGHQNGTRFPVETLIPVRPINPNVGTSLVRYALERKRAGGSGLPRFHGPLGQFRIVAMAPAFDLCARLYPVAERRGVGGARQKQESNDPHSNLLRKSSNSRRKAASSVSSAAMRSS